MQAYYYVSLSGDDSNPGTESLPWKTLAKAGSAATAGATVFIRQGTYNEQLIPVKSGTKEAPIIFTSYPGDTVNISGRGIDFPTGPANDRWWNGLIQIQNLSHIKIIGFRILNSNGSGIVAIGSSYIIIEKNYTDSTWSPGITAVQSDNILIDANEVVHASMGEDQENISISATHQFEIKNNRVGYGFSEGIDVKVGSSSGIVSNNLVYSQEAPNRFPPGFYIDAWDSLEQNIDVYDNISYDNGIGFDIGCENEGLLKEINIHHNKAYNNSKNRSFNSSRGLWLGGWGIGKKHSFRNISIYGNEFYRNKVGMEIGGYTGTNIDSIGVYNNLVYNNAGVGLRITRYDTGAFAIRNLSVINNTIFGNGTLNNGWDADNSGINIFGFNPDKMLVRSNILSNNACYTIFVGTEVLPGSLIADHNFYDGYSNGTYEDTGTNAVFGNSLFVDTLNHDFHLQSVSPGIDKGDTAQKYNDPEDPARPGYALYPAQGTIRNDMGAYGGPYASSWDPASYASIPPSPALVLPFNAVTNVPSTLLLNWNGPFGATSYRLQVSANSDFSSLVLDSANIKGSSYGISDLDNNSQYYWRVSAATAAGAGSWSDTWNFTTAAPTLIKQPGVYITPEYTLAQSYPNPFSLNTTFQFSVPKESYVKLCIYNSMGIEIKVLVNKWLQAGTYRIQWTPQNNVSGIYFCRIKAFGFIDMKKIVFQK